MIIETVEENCPHKDCVYRSFLTGFIGVNGKWEKVDICYYIGYTHKPRGCKISECDKYIPTSKHPELSDVYKIEWVIDYDD